MLRHSLDESSPITALLREHELECVIYQHAYNSDFASIMSDLLKPHFHGIKRNLFYGTCLVVTIKDHIGRIIAFATLQAQVSLDDLLIFTLLDVGGDSELLVERGHGLYNVLKHALSQIVHNDAHFRYLVTSRGGEFKLAVIVDVNHTLNTGDLNVSQFRSASDEVLLAVTPEAGYTVRVFSGFVPVPDVEDDLPEPSSPSEGLYHPPSPRACSTLLKKARTAL